VFVFEADLQPSLGVAARADILVLPVGSALGSELTQELEREVWALIEDLVEHAVELWEHMADRGIKDLGELAKTRDPELQSVQRSFKVLVSNRPHGIDHRLRDHWEVIEEALEFGWDAFKDVVGHIDVGRRVTALQERL